MYNYELMTIAIPLNGSDLTGKFMEFMNKNAGNLWVGSIGVEVEKEEDIKIILEKYVKDVYGLEEKNV